MVVFDGPLYGTLQPTSDSMAWISGAGVRHELTTVAVGDVDGDEYADLAVGSWYDDQHRPNGGATFLFYGPVTGYLGTADRDLELFGDVHDDQAGGAFLSDVDGDGFDDVVVGTLGVERDDGAVVYVQKGGGL